MQRGAKVQPLPRLAAVHRAQHVGLRSKPLAHFIPGGDISHRSVHKTRPPDVGILRQRNGPPLHRPPLQRLVGRALAAPEPELCGLAFTRSGIYARDQIEQVVPNDLHAVYVFNRCVLPFTHQVQRLSRPLCAAVAGGVQRHAAGVLLIRITRCGKPCIFPGPVTAAVQDIAFSLPPGRGRVHLAAVGAVVSHHAFAVPPRINRCAVNQPVLLHVFHGPGLRGQRRGLGLAFRGFNGNRRLFGTACHKAACQRSQAEDAGQCRAARALSRLAENGRKAAQHHFFTGRKAGGERRGPACSRLQSGQQSFTISRPDRCSQLCSVQHGFITGEFQVLFAPARQQPYRRVIPMYGARRQQHRFADDMSALYVRQFMAEHPFQKRAFTQGLRDQHHRTQHAHSHGARHDGIGIYPRCAAHTHRPAGRGVSLLRRRAFHRPVPMERAGAPYRIMRKVPQRTYAHARQPHKAGQPRWRRKKDLSGAENGSFA